MIARPVVVGEDQRTLDGAGRQHDLARPHLPQPLARQIGVGDEFGFGEPLAERHEILRVIAESLRARHEPHVRRGAKRGERVGEPFAGALAVDAARVSARSEPPGAGFSSQTTTSSPRSRPRRAPRRAPRGRRRRSARRNDRNSGRSGRDRAPSARPRGPRRSGRPARRRVFQAQFLPNRSGPMKVL